MKMKNKYQGEANAEDCESDGENREFLGPTYVVDEIS